MAREYEKREFCNAECPLQQFLINDFILGCCPEVSKNLRKIICKEYCVKSAWDFHDWLKRKGFKIIKEDE